MMIKSYNNFIIKNNLMFSKSNSLFKLKKKEIIYNII